MGIRARGGSKSRRILARFFLDQQIDNFVHAILVRLGLRSLAGELDGVLAKAGKARWSAA